MTKPPNHQDFEDLNRELAGISGNRAARFLLRGENSAADGENKRRSRDHAKQTQLDLLMMNPVFADAYRAAQRTADDIQDLLNERRAQLAENIERLESVVEDLEDGTIKLADGRAVFRDEQGRLVDGDKNALTPAEIASITDPGGVADYAPYGQAKDALKTARKRHGTYDDYQDRIDDARKRLKDPPDKDAVEDVQKDLDDLKRELEKEMTLSSSFSESSEPTARPDPKTATLDFTDSKPTS
ncbi:MAG: hypothetical protein AAGA09_03195 [Pseudomonadota bacterium]